MIFLDTDILSYFFGGNTVIRDKLHEYIKSGEQAVLTAINVYEIMKGLRYRNDASKRRLFAGFLRHVTVFTLDNPAIDEAANIYADLRKKGTSIGDADILIAAIVISNSGMLVSNNTKHYQHIKNLRLMNWL
jgi:tRNA(fMet)-specific endonuclease VapC